MHMIFDHVTKFYLTFKKMSRLWLLYGYLGKIGQIVSQILENFSQILLTYILL